ncbi:MAG: acyl-CoA ligase (AMP-forming), exosortase A system-associated [Woeseiaceae bacterium]
MQLHNILDASRESNGSGVALRCGDAALSYAALDDTVTRVSASLFELGVQPGTRIALLLPNCLELVIASLAASKCGCIFVPVNPLQRARQIRHILNDSGAELLVTTGYLFDPIANLVKDFDNLRTVVLVDGGNSSFQDSVTCVPWYELLENPGPPPKTSIGTDDPAAILYTSGSTGLAKGVVLSHANMVSGARIVSGYLGNTAADRILAALPLSFDYGFSQVTTSLYVGAEVVLTNYSMPQKLLLELTDHKITGLAGVPTMWAQLSMVRWPIECAERIRYITNSGGRLPGKIIADLSDRIPQARIFLMYGLTEAFRSTYLDPEEIHRRPDSIGKAIPEVTIHVIRDDGVECLPREQGELVHSGALVSLGYWRDDNATALRFRSLPASIGNCDNKGLAVWSGDTVWKDEEGFIYFVGRSDSMIKASGYRISPSEIEDVLYASGLVEQAAIVGIPDQIAGQRVAIAVVPSSIDQDIDFAIRHICARELPPYMQPSEIRYVHSLPLTANGKPDRSAIEQLFGDPKTDSVNDIIEPA